MKEQIVILKYVGAYDPERVTRLLKLLSGEDVKVTYARLDCDGDRTLLINRDDLGIAEALTAPDPEKKEGGAAPLELLGVMDGKLDRLVGWMEELMTGEDLLKHLPEAVLQDAPKTSRPSRSRKSEKKDGGGGGTGPVVLGGTAAITTDFADGQAPGTLPPGPQVPGGEAEGKVQMQPPVVPLSGSVFPVGDEPPGGIGDPIVSDAAQGVPTTAPAELDPETAD